MHKIHIVQVRRDETSPKPLFFAKAIDLPDFDPGWWRWANGKALLDYTTTTSCKLFTNHEASKHSISSKWIDLPPHKFIPT